MAAEIEKTEETGMKTIGTRALPLLLTLVLLAGLTVPAFAAKKGYRDVPDGHWAEKNIAACSEYGLLEGVGGGKFGLGTQMTRAAYMTALCRLMGWKMESPERGSFRDNLDTGKWYYSAVETAAAHDVISGHNERYARPNDPITREEMASMTVRALGYAELAGALYDADGQPEQADTAGFAGLTARIGKNCPFTDCTTNRGYIALAYRMGIITGVNAKNFNPTATATREQAAAVLARAYEKLHASVSVKTVYASGDVTDAGCATALSMTAAKGETAVSPRAPLEEVYAAAIDAGKGGSVLLAAEPGAQKVDQQGVAREEMAALAEGELEQMLADTAGTSFHHAAQYGSSYLYHREKNGSITCVWYESEDDLAAKVDLCRLLGVKTVYILR